MGSAAGMRIVVAPDSFKESMTAVQAARAMAVGVRDALPTTCVVDQVPVSDGGEGFAEAVTAALAITQAFLIES